MGICLGGSLWLVQALKAAAAKSAARVRIMEVEKNKPPPDLQSRKLPRSLHRPCYLCMGMKHPTFFAVLAASLFAAFLSAPAADADTPRKAKADAKREYVRYVGDDKRGKLQTVIVTMKKDDVQVELVGAVHIADPAYYAELTKLFAGYEELLFELVDGQRMKQQAEKLEEPPKNAKQPKAPLKQGEFPEDNDDEPTAKERSPALKMIGGLMRGLGSYFRFQYQTEGIDYHTKNFVHADVSMDEFLRLQADKGESFFDLMRKAIEAQLQVGSDRNAEPKGSQVLLALLGDPSGLKVSMARQLAAAGDIVTEMEKHDGGTVIITERNRKALAVFDREVAAGRKNLGIFYGAAHLAEMEKDLEKRGYRRTGERWLTAWDIKPRVEQPRTAPAAIQP